MSWRTIAVAMCAMDSETTAVTPPGIPARSVETKTRSGTTSSTDHVGSFERIAIAPPANNVEDEREPAHADALRGCDMTPQIREPESASGEIEGEDDDRGIRDVEERSEDQGHDRADHARDRIGALELEVRVAWG